MHEGVWFQKGIIDKMAAMSTLTFCRLVSTKRGYACSMIVHTRADQVWSYLTLCMHNVDTLNICMKEFCSLKLIIDKMTVMRT